MVIPDNSLHPIKCLYQLHKKLPKGGQVCWKNLYSGSFKSLTTELPNILQRPHQVTLIVTHKPYNKPAL